MFPKDYIQQISGFKHLLLILDGKHNLNVKIENIGVTNAFLTSVLQTNKM